MKKFDVDFQDLNGEMIVALAKAFPNGFADSDVISFGIVDLETENRVKVAIKDTIFLIKKSSLDDAMIDKFDKEYFKSLPRADESCDAEFCDPEQHLQNEIYKICI